MRKLLLILALMLLPIPAFAANTVYTGSLVVPTTGSITQSSGGTGCVIATLGIYSIGNCPAGTAAFSAGTNITITGSNPYTISAPNVLPLTGGTLSGALTVNAAVTATGVTSSGNLTSQGGSGSSCNLQGSEFKNTATSGGDWYVYTGNACTYDASLYWRTQSNNVVQMKLDGSGNLTLTNQVTATQFNISSKRAWKQDIQPLSFDALDMLHHTCWSAYRYRPGHGDPTQTHIGFVADCAPSLLSGKAHDHYDVEAVATTDALAILQLDAQIKVLYACILTLLVLVVLIAMVAFAKRA